MRLYKYVKAMKKLKEAKRYAVTSAIQIHIDDVYLLKREKQTYEDITALITEHLPDDMREEALNYHRDSYYRIRGEMSQREHVWEESGIRSFEPYRKYLETTE